MLQFTLAGKQVVLQVLQPKKITTAQPKEITKEAKMDKACFALSLSEENDVVLQISETMKPLVNRFDDVFANPTQLPPKREIEHHITLKEGSDPVNVRAYQYAHFQEEEIEKQV